MIENLRMSNVAQSQNLIQNMPTAVYTTDIDGILTFYNEWAAELWGCHPEVNNPKENRFCGSSKVFTLDGVPLQPNEYPMARALRKREPIHNEEVIIQRPDESRVVVSVNINPLFENGVFSGAVNVLQDITAQKKIEKSAWHRAAIVKSSDDAIVSKTLDGIITSWNRGAERTFGYTELEMLGESILKLIPPERHNEEDQIIEQIVSGEKIDHFETIRVTKEGKRIPVSLTISPVKNNEGEIIGASKIARDITDQVKTRNELKNLNKKLKKYIDYKNDFIGMASHELKTPITVIKSNLQLLNLKTKSENIRTMIQKTLNNVDKLTTLVIDMLDISKAESGKLQLNYGKFNLVSLLKENIQNMQAVRSSHHIIFEDNNIEEIYLNADKERISQVFINLLTNAIKYSPQSGKVKVKINNRKDEAIIRVTDFGIGIPKDQFSNIFSRFYRVEDLDPTYSGLGIGLFISKDIIERHKGKIWVESELDKGSTFYVKLPTNLSSEH